MAIGRDVVRELGEAVMGPRRFIIVVVDVPPTPPGVTKADADEAKSGRRRYVYDGMVIVVRMEDLIEQGIYWG